MSSEATAHLERLHCCIDAVDSYLAKALDIPEVSRIARLERRLRRFYDAQWNARKKEAAAEAAKLAREGKSAKIIFRVVNSIMRRWAKDVNSTMRSSIREMYRHAREAGWRKASGRTNETLAYSTRNYAEVSKAAKKPTSPMIRIKGPRFDLVDRRSVEILQRQQTFWIGEHYDKNIASGIATTARKTIVESGLGTRRAGEAMGKAIKNQLSYVRTPTGWASSQAQYHELLAANAATVARAQGQLRSFVQLGITRYKIVNPMDRRTCERCAEMNGKVFTTQQGMDQVTSDLLAETPEQVKSSHPWHSTSKVRKLTAGKAGPKQSQTLSENGMAMPPYHGRCRCTIDVDSDIGSFDLSAAKPPLPLPKKWLPTIPIKPPVDKKGIPGIFPKLPRSPATPTTLFNASKFSRAINSGEVVSQRPELVYLTDKNQAVIRREMNSLVAAEGMEVTDIRYGLPYLDEVNFVDGRLLKSMVGVEGEAQAMHTWKGNVIARKKTWESLKGWSPKSRSWRSVGAMKDMVHETVHGASPMKASAYAGEAIVVEEGTAELAAHRIMVKNFGRVTFGTAYEEYIAVLDESVEAGIEALPSEVRGAVKGLGKVLDKKAAREMTERAAVKMRFSQSTRYSSPDAYVNHFIRSVDIPAEATGGMNASEIDKAARKMRKAIKVKFFETVETLE